MTTERHINIGRQTALISFLMGTLIFGLYFLSSWYVLLFVGYAFIVLAGMINIVILISIVVQANKSKDNRKKMLTTCGMMLLNIPLMLFYCWVANMLLNTMRITLTNLTGTTMTNVNLVGCGAGYLDKLASGESETVWVTITGDCSININYTTNGQRIGETVAGYVTNGMGQKMKHNIGGKNEPQF